MFDGRNCVGASVPRENRGVLNRPRPSSNAYCSEFKEVINVRDLPISEGSLSDDFFFQIMTKDYVITISPLAASEIYNKNQTFMPVEMVAHIAYVCGGLLTPLPHTEPYFSEYDFTQAP